MRSVFRIQPQEYAAIPRALLLFFGLSVVLAGVLRFSWLSDMEYKDDERWMFEHAQAIPAREPWPTLGMPSGVGLRNPGLSVSVFAVLARLVGVVGPIDLCQGVVAANTLAFALLLVAVFRLRPSEQREPWLWALALSAVNPLALLLQRKIWAQSVLPLFCVCFLIGWLRRNRYWGAALWGFVGALLGQVHMSGFFFAAAFFVCDVGWNFVRGSHRRTKWLGWFLGSVAGAWPLIPWFQYVLSSRDRSPSQWLENVLSLRFFRYWFSDSLGLGLDYSLGGQYLDFLRYPLVWTEDLYPALYLHGIALSAGLYLLFCVGQATWNHLPHFNGFKLSGITDEGLVIFSALVGFGILLTLSGVDVQRHYLVITFPIEWLLVAYWARSFVAHPRRLLFLLWGTQLGLSLTFLHYIHENHGATDGDYGRAFRWNTEHNGKP